MGKFKKTKNRAFYAKDCPSLSKQSFSLIIMHYNLCGISCGNILQQLTHKLDLPQNRDLKPLCNYRCEHYILKKSLHIVIFHRKCDRYIMQRYSKERDYV